MDLTITDAATPEEVALIGGNLAAFNDVDVGPSRRRAIAVLVRNGQGALLAGLNGYTAWGWLYVQWLWVDESLRGQGMAGRMLQAAEEEARARGCHGTWIDTFNPAAEKAYTRQGYAVFGQLDDFPAGRSRKFLQKKL